MIKVKRQQVRKKKVEDLFNSLKKDDLLEDRAVYSEEDLQQAYPQLNKKGVKLLYLKLQKWKYSKLKVKKRIASNNCLNPKD